jgi:3-oxoacyl-[acyl-carrier protein] reductase
MRGAGQSAAFTIEEWRKALVNLALEGRVAMVAAASKGIGLASALSLAREGCKVSICGRSPESLAAARTEIEAVGDVYASAVDVSSLRDLDRWHAETAHAFGEVDILVTNTGGPPVARFAQLTDEQWQAGVDSTLMNVVRLSRLVLPSMRARRWGRIIHLTSLVAKQPMDELTISSTLRAGLSGLTKTMANQFGPDNITVNAVLMGHILTDRQRHLAAYRAPQQGISTEEYLARVADEIPLKRIGSPAEVGDVVAFLASERASYITGTSLAVDGGIIRGTM